MKVLGVLLLCVCVSVQGRSAGLSRSEVALGDAPWLVHLRTAVSTSGLLQTAAGALINKRYVLTSADAVEEVRFIWIRYGTVTVINPSLVTESSLITTSEDNKIALININRNVETTDFIVPVALADASSSLPSSATLFVYGQIEENVPGETLKSFEVALESQDDVILATSDEDKASKFDLGAPLVNDGVLVGVLVQAGDDDSAAVFAKVANYLEWIETEACVEDCPEEEEEEEEEEEGEEDEGEDDDGEEEDETLKVHFVN